MCVEEALRRWRLEGVSVGGCGGKKLKVRTLRLECRTYLYIMFERKCEVGFLHRASDPL